MKILHVIPSLDPETGGPPRIAVALAAAQASLNHTVHIASYGAKQSLVDSTPDYKETPYSGHIGLLDLGKVTRKESFWGKRAQMVFGKAVPSFDVIHLHNVWETVLDVAAKAARQNKKPYYVLANGMLDPWSLSQKSWKKKLALALRQRKMLEQATALHVGNKEELHGVRKIGIQTRAEIVPNGVFLDQIDSSLTEDCFGKLFPELADKRFVLFLSRLHYKKGLDVLADAFYAFSQVHPDWHLVVAGPDGGAQEPFTEQIRKHQLTERVHMVGPLYGQAKFAALAAAQCFCLPSRQEGFSVAILEALACGLPVVITEQCHFPEVAKVGAGRVIPLSTENVANALEEVTHDEQAGKHMGQCARNLIESRYTWQQIAKETINFYTKDANVAKKEL